jgi:hypothetical protein
MQIKTPLKPVVIDTPFTGPITPNIILGDAGEGNAQGTIMDANATMTAIKKAVEEGGGGGGTTECSSPYKVIEVTAHELESWGVGSEDATIYSNQINNMFGNYGVDTQTPSLGWSISLSPTMSFMEAAVLNALDVWDEVKFAKHIGIASYCAQKTAGEYVYHFITGSDCYVTHGVSPNTVTSDRQFCASYYNGSSTANKHTFAVGNTGAIFDCKINSPLQQVCPFEMTDSKKTECNVLKPTVFPRNTTIGEVNGNVNSVVINNTTYNGDKVPGIELIDTVGTKVIGFYVGAAGHPVISLNRFGKEYLFDFDKAISLGILTEA